MKNHIEDENEKLRKLNEEKKRQIEDEFGPSVWGKSEENDLPPEIENQFLDHIMAFERSYKDAKRITVYDYLGKPNFIKAEDLNDTEIQIELENIFELMLKNELRLDTICEVPDRELYRFITEELFPYEIDDMRIPGMFCSFIYEEFHPNHEHDIKSNAADFFRTYFDKTSDYYRNFLTTEAQKKDWHNHFRSAFDAFEVIDFEISQLNFDTENATVEFTCKVNGKVDGAKELFSFEGNGNMKLNYEWDYWRIDSIDLPSSKII